MAPATTPLRASAPHLLIVDDEAQMCSSLKKLLEERQFRVTTASSAKEGLRVLQQAGIDLVLCDIVMPDMSGLLFLDKVGRRVPVVMMTAYASIETTRRAFKLGACDYLVKPFALEELLVVVHQNLAPAGADPGARGQAVLLQSHHPAFRQVLELARRFSQTDMPVLLTGESGVGKEVIAQYIHENSDRRHRPLLGINCAAIPDTLLESELFGYEKGAFTGAVSGKAGKFEEADGGVLFLDEIGDMPLGVQAKMLRVLQDFTITRLGGTQPIRVNIRILAATNHPLDRLLARGTLRSDLYHRLNGLVLSIPPLRERLEDLPLLAAFFIDRFNGKYGKSVRELSPEALAIFRRYGWPGNIRELKNCLERAVVVCDDPTILPEHLPDSVCRLEETGAGGPASAGPSSLEDAYRTQYLRKVILEALARAGGNRIEAARLLKISRRTLYSRMKELDIRYDFS